MVMIGSRTLEKLRFCSLSLLASADGSMAGLILNRVLLLTCVLTLTLVSNYNDRYFGKTQVDSKQF